MATLPQNGLKFICVLDNAPLSEKADTSAEGTDIAALVVATQDDSGLDEANASSRRRFDGKVKSLSNIFQENLDGLILGDD